MNPFIEPQKGRLHIELAENLSFPEHLHSHTEFLYMLEGETRLSIGDSFYNMHQGDCALIFPGQIHSYHTADTNRIWLLVFDTNLTASFQYTLQKSYPICPFLPAGSISPDVLLAIDRLNYTDVEKSPALGSAWLQIILAHTLPLLELTEKKQPENEDLIYQLLHYMAEHFQEPLSLDSLAKALHVNKFYLSHIFSEKLHMSFPKYLNYLRIEYVCNAMKNSRLSLTTIWADAGFSSQRSFNRAFMALKGMSPLAYRKSL